MVSRVIPVDPFDLTIFGGTGDLAKRKILPGLFRRHLSGQMPQEAQIIGAARSDLSDEEYRGIVRAAVLEFGAIEHSDADLDEFLARVSYLHVDAKGSAGWTALKSKMRDGFVRVFYFSVAPALFGDLAERLHEHDIALRDSRIVVEKPFGKDLETARALNGTLAKHFHEDQIYRIDHYLGKETVQNLMAIRFGNMLFEPLWNAQFIDHIQITVAETVGVGGRGGYYDQSGAMRDMVQNHLMQLLCLIAMEPPSNLIQTRCAMKSLRLFAPLTLWNPTIWCAVNIVQMGIIPIIAVPWKIHDHVPKVLWPLKPISATGVGRVHPFTCARANVCARALLKLLWCLRKRRIPFLALMRDHTAMRWLFVCNQMRVSRWM